ncbi:MAG: LysM peptidoglycan-binding domain-containing protein [Anaerolineae bacterium]|nr:LysM peptidoglycan-binding domain-containing protein [Anaerolineae bacterium]
MAILRRLMRHPDMRLILAIIALGVIALVLMAQLFISHGLIDTPLPTVAANLAVQVTSIPATDAAVLTATAIIEGTATPLPTATPTETATATPTATDVPPTPLPENLRTHVVQRGDSFYRIGQAYGVTAEAVAAANGMVVTDTIYVGQELFIPEGAIFPDSTASPPPTFLPTLTPVVVADANASNNVEPTTVPQPTSGEVGFVIASPRPTNQPLLGGGPRPTYTLALLPSSTPFPTNTPIPTSTPAPTGTPVPSSTPNEISLVATEVIVPTESVPPTSLPTSPPTEQFVAASDLGIVATAVIPTVEPAPILEVHGIAMSQLVYMPPEVIGNMRALYVYGQSLGRNAHAFSKVGDSTIEPPHFLVRFDQGPYNLGEYAYLQSVIDYYHGSFERDSIAVRRGMHTWSALDPMWAGAGCNPGENPIECEIRLNNPSVIILRLGSNDRGVPDMTERNIREIVEICMGSGVIPIIATKADRFEGGNSTNTSIRQIAADYRIPLWDLDLISSTIPGRGLGPDGVHLSIFYAHDWTLGTAWTQGNAVQNLTALMALYQVRLVLRDLG